MNLKLELNKFETITLSEMDDVKLMSRTDTKFVFNFLRLPEFLEKLSSLEVGLFLPTAWGEPNLLAANTTWLVIEIYYKL